MGRTRAEPRAKVVARLDGTVRGELERDLVVNKVRLARERAALPFIVAPVRCPLARLCQVCFSSFALLKAGAVVLLHVRGPSLCE